MSQRMETFDDDQSIAIALLVDELSRVAEMQVACIGFVDQEEHLAMTYCPGFERAVTRYMAGVNWASALRLVEEHTV